MMLLDSFIYLNFHSSSSLDETLWGFKPGSVRCSLDLRSSIRSCQPTLMPSRNLQRLWGVLAAEWDGGIWAGSCYWKDPQKSPWRRSGEEWDGLSIQTYDIEPTNLARHNIYRDVAWIKSIWNDVRKYLYQVFVQYNRAGQCSGDMGEWCSPEEQQRWVRAAFWKGGSTNTIV